MASNRDKPGPKEKKKQTETKSTKELTEEEIKNKEEGQREKLRALSSTLGIDKQNEEIDKLNQSTQYIAEKMEEAFTVIKKQSEAINKLLAGGKTSEGDTMQNLEALDSIFNSPLGKAIGKKLFGGGGSTHEQDDFTKKLLNNSKKEALESQSITSLLNKKVKSKLIDNVVGEVFTETTHESTHTPNNTNISEHGPK